MSENLDVGFRGCPQLVQQISSADNDESFAKLIESLDGEIRPLVTNQLPDEEVIALVLPIQPRLKCIDINRRVDYARVPAIVLLDAGCHVDGICDEAVNPGG